MYKLFSIDLSFLTLQSDKPTMVAEFWDGWFDHWGEMHHTRDVASVAGVLEEILKFGSSVNLYMFHGLWITCCLFTKQI